MRNWSGTIEFGAQELLTPTSVAELSEIVTRHPRVRALGTAHCFTSIADTDGVQVSVAALPSDITISADRRTVDAPAAIRIGELGAWLHGHGLALPNFASLGHISLAGAVATGTHGSGDRNPTLAGTVVGLEYVGADGSVHRTRRGEPDFQASVVALGLLGIVTRVEVEVVPAVDIKQHVFVGLPTATLIEDFDAITSAAYSVSVFTTWADEAATQVWLKRRVDQSANWPGSERGTFHGALRATTPMHPLPGHDPVHCTEQLGVPGPAHARLPHFRLDFTPSSGDEIQSEYLLPRAQIRTALARIHGLRHLIAPLLHVSEIRTMAADDLWLSGAFERDTVGVHFTWHRTAAVYDLLPLIEEQVLDLGGRPHWGKVFTAPPSAVRALYPRFTDMADLVQERDPSGRFGNLFTARLGLSAS